MMRVTVEIWGLGIPKLVADLRAVNTGSTGNSDECWYEVDARQEQAPSGIRLQRQFTVKHHRIDGAVELACKMLKASLGKPEQARRKR